MRLQSNRFGADLSIAKIPTLALRSTISAHGHPAAIGDDPPLFDLMANDGGESSAYFAHRHSFDNYLQSLVFGNSPA